MNCNPQRNLVSRISISLSYKICLLFSFSIHSVMVDSVPGTLSQPVTLPSGTADVFGSCLGRSTYYAGGFRTFSLIGECRDATINWARLLRFRFLSF
jgi:hypothetical protein